MSGGPSLAIASRIVGPWLYRKIDLDFTGAESVGTILLLKNVIDEALDVRKCVQRVTVTIGPLVIGQGATIIGRYLDYISTMIPPLPQCRLSGN